MRTELREAAVITVAVAVAGVLLGLLWVWLAPNVPLVGDLADDQWVVYFKDTEGEQAIGVDGTFALLALACGAVSAVAVFWWRRRGESRSSSRSRSAASSARCWPGGWGCGSGPTPT